MVFASGKNPPPLLQMALHDIVLTYFYSFLCMSFMLIVFQWFILGQINKRRDEEHPHPNDYTTEMKRAEMDSGDQASFFRYTR